MIGYKHAKTFTSDHRSERFSSSYYTVLPHRGTCINKLPSHVAKFLKQYFYQWLNRGFY
jgi:hypothetical protein